MDRPQRLARKAEEETARLHQGRVTPMSGSGQTVKNDVRNAEWSYEVKSTEQKGFRLTWSGLIVAARQAVMDGKRMAFIIQFNGGPGSRPGRYVVTDENDFIEREQELAQLREENAKLWAKIEADC